MPFSQVNSVLQSVPLLHTLTLGMSVPYMSAREVKEGNPPQQLLALRGISAEMPALRSLSLTQFSLNEDSFHESISAPKLTSLRLASCYSA